MSLTLGKPRFIGVEGSIKIRCANAALPREKHEHAPLKLGIRTVPSIFAPYGCPVRMEGQGVLARDDR